MEQFYVGKTNGCAWDMRCPKTGELLHKCWWLVTTDPKIAAFFNSRQCPNKPGLKVHNHKPIEGSLTTLSASYPPKMTKGFAKELLSRVSRKVVRDMAAGAEASSAQADNAETTTVELDDAETEAVQNMTKEDEELVWVKVKQLHEELQHTNPTALAEELKRRNAHPGIVAVAKRFKCQVCEEAARLPWRPAVKH